MEPWEFQFDLDEIARRQWLHFGTDLRAWAGLKPPLDWRVEQRCDDKWFMPLASTAVASVGLMALDQRQNYDVIGAFDITGALREVADCESAHAVIKEAARLQLAWEILESRKSRGK